MGSDQVDVGPLLESFERREYYSLPFDVTVSDPSAATGELRADLAEAIAAANLSAESRVPRDPTWCTPPDLIGGRFVGEISEGTMEDDEVRAWLLDLAEECERRGLPVHIGVHAEHQQPPNLDAWASLPPAVSAFLFFIDPSRSRTGRRISPETIRATAAPLVRWSRLPGGTLVVEKGLAEQVTRPAVAVEELLQVAAERDQLQFGLHQSTNDPPRLRLARFTYDARGAIQVHAPDELLGSLGDVLHGVRVFAGHLDYANVRRSQVTVPSDYDPPIVLGREMTPMEEVVAWGQAAHLLADYVPDAYVAQVLTDRHLERATDLSLFRVESMGDGRHLVTAADPAPWLTGLNPDAETLTAARAGFGEMLLTPAVIAANPPGWHQQAT